MEILVETSARHIHLSQHDLEILFGKDKKLTVRKFLSQPGQFACTERLDIIGPKGTLEDISILGPVRNQTQVEISLTDARHLGISAPIRDSGDIQNTPGCTLIGPVGSLTIEKGIIVAKRHIHLDPSTASKLNLKDKQNVLVKINSNDRSLIFDKVLIRVNENFSPAMHIDTDESNAAGITTTTYGNILI